MRFPPELRDIQSAQAPTSLRDGQTHASGRSAISDGRAEPQLVPLAVEEAAHVELIVGLDGVGDDDAACAEDRFGVASALGGDGDSGVTVVADHESDGAERAKAAGFDGLEVHASNG